jgi:tetratricopeptide (TPR) repeat protein
MDAVDLKKLKASIGSAISWSSFVSATQNSEVALKYAGCGQGQSDQKSVLFEIELDKRLPNAIHTVGNRFANITGYSDKNDENEILLSIGSIFRIESVKKCNSIWIVKLVMIEEQINELMSRYLRELEGKTNVSRLGSFLAKIGDYNRAIKYKHLLLDDYLSKNEDQVTIALIYNNLAISYNEKGEITKAFDYFQRSLTLLTHNLPPGDPIFFSIFNNLGIMYLRRAEYTNAIKMFSRALVLTKYDVCKRILVHIHLATVYSEQGNMIKVDAHLTKALNRLSKKDIGIPKTHPIYGRIYNMLGTVYVHKNELAKAQKFFEQARSIEATLSPKNPSSIGVKLNNMAVVLGENGDYDSALKKARDALQSLPPESADRASIFNNLGVIYRSMGEYQMALDAYHEALKIDLKYKSPDHPSFAIRYLNIGCAHFVMLEFDLACDMLQKSLSIALKSSKANNSKLIGSIYRTLGTVYLALGDHVQGEANIKKAFDIDPIAYEKYSNPLTAAYRTLANIFEINKNVELAQHWNKKTFSTQITQANLG